ncbi:MAG TPA: hypothetical protein VFA18_16885 [Gemmataceae bacterium]|nr:hypothetical protein [Gemmataceae bacterium]
MRGLAAAPLVMLGLALVMPGCQSADQPPMPTHFSADQVVLDVPGMV